MEEIIVIRAADPDGSVFKAVVDALRGKRAEVVSVAAPVSSMLRIGELEIYHEQKRVIMAGREVQLTGASLLKSAALCGGLGRGISTWDELRGEYHLALEKETGE